MDIAFGKPEKNFKAIEEYVKKAAGASADVVVFPEMWNTGYALNQLNHLADVNGNTTRELLARLANTFKVNIVGGSVSTKKEDGFYNTMYVIDRSGKIVAEYDKAHLFKLMNEHLFMNEGQSKNIFEIDGTKCGGVICYDLRFPEWIRTHVLDGVKIMFIPAEWPKQRIDHWRLLIQARAIENQCYVVAVNRVGKDPNNEFNGHSMVVSPWGELLLCDRSVEGIFYVELDLSEVERVRKTMPIFQDRRTDLY